MRERRWRPYHCRAFDKDGKVFGPTKTVHAFSRAGARIRHKVQLALQIPTLYVRARLESPRK